MQSKHDTWSERGVPEWLRFELVKAVCVGHVP